MTKDPFKQDSHGFPRLGDEMTLATVFLKYQKYLPKEIVLEFSRDLTEFERFTEESVRNEPK